MNDSQHAPQHVLLLHGLLMHPLAMRYIGQALTWAGFRSHYFPLSTISKSSAENAIALKHYIEKLAVDSLHIIAHSLGGIVTLHLLAKDNNVPPGRVVMLGSPVQGSELARRLSPWPFFSTLLENSLRDSLSGENIPVWSGDREWGMIAGSSAFGQGTFLGGFDSPNDGTVTVAETRHPAQTDHIVLPVTHTQMQLSPAVNQQVIHFLQHGCFQEGDR